MAQNPGVQYYRKWQGPATDIYNRKNALWTGQTKPWETDEGKNLIGAINSNANKQRLGLLNTMGSAGFSGPVLSELTERQGEETPNAIASGMEKIRQASDPSQWVQTQQQLGLNAWQNAQRWRQTLAQMNKMKDDEAAGGGVDIGGIAMGVGAVAAAAVGAYPAAAMLAAAAAARLAAAKAGPAGPTQWSGSPQNDENGEPYWDQGADPRWSGNVEWDASGNPYW